MLDPAKLKIPEHLGHVTDTFNPQPKGTPPKRLVLHLQDLHTQYDAQQALAQLIEALHRSTKVSLVALEGGAGPGDTEFFSAFPDAETTDQLAAFFLKKGLFTGPVYYAVTHPGEVSLYGVEDPAIYLEHLSTYQVGYAKQQEATRQLEALFTILHELQEQLYSKALKALMAKAKAYEEGKLEFSQYLQELKHLASEQQLLLDGYPNLERFLHLVSVDRRIDRSAVEDEHRQLFEMLNQQLTEDDLHALLAHRLAFGSGKLTEAEYYQGLRRFARKVGIRLNPPERREDAPPIVQAAKVAQALLVPSGPTPYANLIAYTESLQLSAELHYDQLRSELEQLVSALKDRLFTTPDQRQLDKLLAVLDVLQDLYNVRLSPDHYHYYQRHKASFTAQPFLTFLTTHQRLTPELTQALQLLFADLSTQERFYTIAQQRDEALVTNTLKQMDEQHQAVAILVTGGFHTEGIKQLLKDRGIAYAVISPESQGKMDEGLYSALLRNQVPSVEELISSLSTELASRQTTSVRDEPSGFDDELIPDPGIFASSDQINVQTGKPSVGRTDKREAPGQSKRSYLREAWTYLKTTLLSLKGWSVERIQSAYATHPTLNKVLGFEIKANGHHQVVVGVNGSLVTYEPDGGSVKVVSVEHKPPREAMQVASVEPGTTQTLPVGAGVPKAPGSLRPKSSREDAENLQLLDHDLSQLEDRDRLGAEAVSTPGPAIRWSGLELTEAQHGIVNDSIAAYFTDPVKVRQRRLLDENEYRGLDPEGLLRANDVRIYVFDGLIDRIRELARQRGLDEPPTDLIIHPGRRRRQLYLDASYLSLLLGRDRAWRVALAHHEWAHIEHPNEDEVAIQVRAPLPPGILGERERKEGYADAEAVRAELARREGAGLANNPGALQKPAAESGDRALYLAAQKFGIELPKSPRARKGEPSLDESGAIGKGSVVSQRDRVAVTPLPAAQRAHVRSALDALHTKVTLAALTEEERAQANQVLEKLEAFFARSDAGALGTFDAIIQSSEDYLLAFADSTRIVLFNNAFSPDFVNYLDELLFHEGYVAVFGEGSYEAHRTIVAGLQRKIFGQANPLRDILRSYIDAQVPLTEPVTLASDILNVQAVMDADPILSRLETVGAGALRQYASAGRRPLIYLVGSEALKTATGLATLVTLRNQIKASGTTKLVNVVYVHTDPVLSQEEFFKAIQVEGSSLFDVSVDAVTQATELVKTQIVEAVNANIADYRKQTSQTIETLPPVTELTRSNTVTLASNAQEPVPVEQRHREERIFRELVTDAIHVLVQQPDSTDAKAVADYSRAVTSTLVALSESKEAPPELKEDIAAVRKVMDEGGVLTIPPRPSSVLHDIDQRFKAQRAVRSQV